jgi:hypothetical protein
VSDKTYEYLTVDVDGDPIVWTTDDLLRSDGGYWSPRERYRWDVGTPLSIDLITPALREKARNHVVKIKIIIEEVQDENESTSR